MIFLTVLKRLEDKDVIFFWNELTNLVTRLTFIKSYKETNDIYTEELEDRFDKERRRRQQLRI